MVRLCLRARSMGLVLASAVTVMLACEPSNDVKPGPPELLSFQVVDPAGSPVDLNPDGGAVAVSPLVRFVASFDRLLDGNALEETIDGGVAGRPGVAVFEAPGNPLATVGYSPNGDSKFHLLFPSGPSLQIMASPTLPSGSPVRLSLDKTRVRGKDGSSYVLGPGAVDTLSFTTQPFTASIDVPAPVDVDGGAADSGVEADAPAEMDLGGDADVDAPTGDADVDAPAGDAVDAGAPPGPPVDAAFKVTVAFTNLPAADINSHLHVSRRGPAGDQVPVPVQITADLANPAALVISAEGGAWPAGAIIDVLVDGDAADALGIKITGPVTASFVTGP